MKIENETEGFYESLWNNFVSLQLHDLAKDAARYRWMRDIGDSTWTPMASRAGCSAGMIDSAIDIAIAKHGDSK